MNKRWCILLIAVVLLSVFLVSCEDKVSGGLEGVAESDADSVRIEYLNERIRTLEAELLALRSESYVTDAEYRARILALTAELSALKGEPMTDPESETRAPVTEGAPNVSDRPETEEEKAQKNVILFSVTDGEATVTGYTGSEVRLDIPSELGGYPVVAIADNAFSRTDLREITVHEGVRRIGWFAFSENVALERVSLPSSIEKAEYGIFNGCSGKLTVYCESDSYIAAYARSYGITVK